MSIAKGMSLGPYEILARIGEGGMGEVWRARDRRIGRDVAVKVLHEDFASGDPEAVQRFEQEARAAGALNHPGLVTIFDVGTTDGAPYLVMELLEGQTLRNALDIAAGRPLQMRKAIDYAAQIAEALAVTHDKGIIHRDLKPENIFITAEGRVKILDFGLAKLAVASDADGRRRTSRHLTSAGIVVGTPGYMSPEQVRALPIDQRTDIFSLGTVLYEMLSGRSPFESQSAIETMHAVLNVEPPPLSTFEPTVPPALEAIVRHCLEKNPRARFQSAHDLAFQLRMLEVQPSAADHRRATLTPAPAAAQRSYRLPIAVAAAVLVLGAGGFALYRARGAEPASAQRTFRQLTFGDGLEMLPSLAPDGKSFAYVSAQSGNRDIYVQRVDGRTAINLTADSPDDDSQPAFSPDGSQIAFRSERDGGGIFVMGATGESVRRLTNFGYNPSWSPDGTRIVVSTQAIELRPHVHGRNGYLTIVDTRSGATKPLVRPGVDGPDFGRGSDSVQPSWSPNGHRIAFWGLSTSSGHRDLWTIDPDAPQPKRSVVRVTADASLEWNPVWSPDGKYLYFGSDRDGTVNLWRIPMDEESGKPAGEPEPLSLPAAMSGNFTFSQQGELAFTSVTQSYRLLALPFDAQTARTGEPRALFGSSQEILSFEPSPDGKLVAFTTSGGQEDLFVANADGTRLRQLTNDVARDRGVSWSPDGKTLYFYSNRNGDHHIWSIHTDGSGLAPVVDARDLGAVGEKNIYMPDVSPDGRILAAQTATTGALVHLHNAPPKRIERFGKDVQAPKWSPDGTRIVADVRSPLQPAFIALYSLATRRFDKVLDRGMAPDWLPDGRRIVFFESAGIGIYDLERRAVTASPFTPPPGARLDDVAVWPRLSRDGSTLYVRQTLEQGDVWLVRFATE